MNLIIYFLQVTICLCLFYALYYFALQKETTYSFNRLYLLCTLIISVVLPLITINIDLSSAPVLDEAAVFVAPYTGTMQAVVVSAEADSFNFWSVIPWIYVLGVALLILKLIRELAALQNIQRKGRSEEIYGHACILSPEIKAPFSFAGTIFLPLNHSFSDEELLEVIRHERAHISGYHSVDVMLMEFFQIALWPCLPVYLYKRKLRELHEYFADAEVIKYSPWEQYARFLIAQKENQLQYRLSNHLVHSQLKNRFIMMTQRPSSTLSRLKYFGILPLLLVTIVLFSFKDKEILPANLFANEDQSQETHISVDDLQENAAQVSDENNNTVSSASAVPSPSDNTEMPLFPGCDKAPEMEKKSCSQNKLYEFVAQELKYPEELLKANIEGKVHVKFVVGANGLVGEPTIAKSLHPAADEAALNVVRAMNAKVGAWTPARKEGRIVSMEMLLPVSFVSNAKGETQPYTYVEEMPQFPGGMQEMYKYIYDNIKYPEEDKAKEVQGMVVTQFVVREDGSISDIKIVRGLSKGTDAEVVRIMEGMNKLPEKWTPGKNGGKVVPVLFTLPIKFVIPEEQKEEVKPHAKNEKTDAKELSALYPNPTTGKVNVDITENAQSIRVTDLSGNVIMTKNVKGDRQVELDITSLVDGTYIVQVITPDQTHSLRMVKGKN